MGDTSVALCVPAGLEVNGNHEDLPDGNSLALPSAVLVSRSGNAYNILGPGGEAVLAKTYPDHIDVSVFLGRNSTELIRGLLGSARGNTQSLGMRDGTALPNPPTYQEFTRYGESWRVQPAESVLCTTGAVVPGMPTKPVYGQDLPEPERNRVERICREAGVKEGPFLDDCMLDVSVLGDNSAANPFVSIRAPIRDIRPTFP
jgi:hypothetical protein